MLSIGRDLRYALRSLNGQRAFTFLAVLTLGLGIGAATTIFSVIENVLLDPYPYAHMDRNVSLLVEDTSRPGSGGRAFFKVAELLDYHRKRPRGAQGTGRRRSSVCGGDGGKGVGQGECGLTKHAPGTGPGTRRAKCVDA